MTKSSHAEKDDAPPPVDETLLEQLTTFNDDLKANGLTFIVVMQAVVKAFYGIEIDQPDEVEPPTSPS
jgi:hypothetical protein